ncbi:MAG: AraC family transcriptional regulator [Ignavibacteriaceae bacterium]
MKLFDLPQDIYPGSDIQNDKVIFHDYSAPAGAFKGKSVLHKNAVSLVIKGEKTMHFAEKKVYVNENGFHLLSAGNCIVTMNLSKKQIFRSLLIFFDNKIMADFYIKYNEKISGIKERQKIKPEPYISIKKDPFIINFISSLKVLLQTQKIISSEMKLVKFEELMLHLLENYPYKLLSFPAGNRDNYEIEIRKVVETNISNKITVDDLAFLCNLSTSTFKRRFTKIYNTSPQKWFLQKRMELAGNLLRHHNEKPGEVYYKVGYENHSSFTSSFRKIYGITPKEYKQKLNASR